MTAPFGFDLGQLTLPFIKDTKVELNFNGDLLSSDGGALLLRQVEDQIGIVKQLASLLRDNRDQRYVTHSMHDQLLQRVLLIASGYEDANDSDRDRLRQDAAFKIALGRRPDDDQDLASQPTISRFENTPSRTELYRLGTAFVDHFVASYDSPPEWIILDFDDTEDKTYGNQQLALFNGYYGDTCYLPLHIYEATSGKLVTSILKPGQRATGKQMLSIVKRLIGHLRHVWPDTTIVFRGDSHFAYPEVMDWIEDQDKANQTDDLIGDDETLKGRTYHLTGLTANAVLKRMVQTTIDQAIELSKRQQKPVCLYHEVSYKAESWSIPRRVYAKIKADRDKVKVHFRVTNIKHMRPSVVEKKAYNPRACCELRIKDHKCDLKSDRTSCHRFQANQFRLFLHSAAYVLVHTLTTQLLKTTSWAKATIGTIIQCLFKIAVRIQVLKTKIKVTFPRSHPNLKTLHSSFAILGHLQNYALE